MSRNAPYVELARCTGHCCKSFPLPVTMAVLRADVEAVAAGDITARHFQDGAQVLDMLIPLGEPTGDVQKDRYTCRHHGADGNCGIYETRPRMCSEYPYGQPCRIEGCTRVIEELVTIRPRGLLNKAKLWETINAVQAKIEEGSYDGKKK